MFFLTILIQLLFRCTRKIFSIFWYDKDNIDLQFPVSNRYDANENYPDSFLTPVVSGVAFIRILVAIKGKLEPA